MGDNKENIPFSNWTFKTRELEILKKMDNDQSRSSSKKLKRYFQILTQMIGLISVKGNDEFIKRQNELFECVYSNGFVVITFKNKKLQIWTISGHLKKDINGDVEYVDVLPFVSMTLSDNNLNLKPVRLKGDECVLIKSAPFGFNLWYVWDEILQDHVDLMDIFLTNAKLNVKKLQWVINNESEAITDAEIESVLDFRTPYIKTINPIIKIKEGDIREASGEQNIFSTLELGGSGTNGFEDVINHWIFETNLMGLFADEYHKKERNTAGENEMTQANTIIIHDVILREFKKAEKEIKEKFNINVEFFKTFEFSAENNNENSENNNGGENNEVE